MKRFSLFVLAFLLSVAPAFATIEVQEDGTSEGQAAAINFSTGLTNTCSGSTCTVVADPTDITSAVFEGSTADAYETTLDVVDPTADQTASLPNFAVNYAIMGSTLTTNNVDAANSVWFTSNSMKLEGATADAYETTISPVDPTADQTISIPNNGAASAIMTSALTTNAVDAANAVTGISNGLLFEGATADAFETTLSPVDPTADQTVSIPNNGAASAIMTSALTTNAVDAANAVTGMSNGLLFEGATADAFETTLTLGDPTADQTVTIPATAGAAGTVALKGATVSITPGTTPTLTVPLGVDFIATDTIVTDNQDQTIGASSGGSLGQRCTIIFTTDTGGSGDEVITFGTNFLSTGTLTLANLTADRYNVTFISDGTVFTEVSRTAVQTT